MRLAFMLVLGFSLMTELSGSSQVESEFDRQQAEWRRETHIPVTRGSVTHFSFGRRVTPVVIKLNELGEPLPNFNNGKIRFLFVSPAANYSFYTTHIAETITGKYLITGQSNDGEGVDVMRVNKNLTLDSQFATNGFVKVPDLHSYIGQIPGDDNNRYRYYKTEYKNGWPSIATDSSYLLGSFFKAIKVQNNNYERVGHLLISRLLPNGQLDHRFGESGIIDLFRYSELDKHEVFVRPVGIIERLENEVLVFSIVLKQVRDSDGNLIHRHWYGRVDAIDNNGLRLPGKNSYTIDKDDINHYPKNVHIFGDHVYIIGTSMNRSEIGLTKYFICKLNKKTMEVDATFGDNGYVYDNFNVGDGSSLYSSTYNNKIALTSDVDGGIMAVAMYSAVDGKPIRQFSGDGKVTMDVSALGDGGNVRANVSGIYLSHKGRVYCPLSMWGTEGRHKYMGLVIFNPDGVPLLSNGKVYREYKEYYTNDLPPYAKVMNDASVRSIFENKSGEFMLFGSAVYSEQ